MAIHYFSSIYIKKTPFEEQRFCVCVCVCVCVLAS